MCALRIIWLAVVVVTVVTTVQAASGGEGEQKQNNLPSNCGRFLNFKFFRGNKTEPDDYPWLALIEYETPWGRQAFCGGVLISNRYVLTAAHCASSNENWTVDSVRLGEYDRTTEIDCMDEGDADNTMKCIDNARSVKVDKSIVHEGFKYGQAGSDIALLRLAEEVKFDEYVQPICLPDKTSSFKRFEIAGWGMMGGRPSNDIKLRSYVTLFDRTTCVKGYAAQGVYLTDDQICLGGVPKESVCLADSGGPLMGLKQTADGIRRMTVYGVFTHFHNFCDAKGWPGIFTDVLMYKDWIVQHVQEG